MTEADKAIAQCVNQIVNGIDDLSRITAEGGYDVEFIQSHIIDIDSKMTILKQRLIIDNNGLQLTQPPRKNYPGYRRPVLCVETGKVYDSISEAAADSGVNAGNISQAIRGILSTAGGYHWEEYIRDRRTSQKLYAPVECVETGEIFESAAAAGREYKISSRKILAAIKSGERADGCHWRLVEQEQPEIKGSVALVEWTVPESEK